MSPYLIVFVSIKCLLILNTSINLTKILQDILKVLVTAPTQLMVEKNKEKQVNKYDHKKPKYKNLICIYCGHLP